MKTDDVNRLIDQRQALNETPPCKTHPDAPHGFDRNASHSADRYVCECEGWEPDVDNSAHEAENVYRNVDNVNMSEKHVHKSDKSIHEPVAWMWKDGTLTSDPDFADGTWTPLFTSPVHASDISQERVDETAKGKHEPVGGEWVPCVKLPVIVHVRNQRDGENHISTREGITPVLPEDLIMRGVAGEEYPIGRELFERTYTFDVDAVNTSQDHVDETTKGEHMIDCTDEQLMEEVRRRGFLIRNAQIEREWVGLTDEDLEPMCDDWRIVFGPYVYDFARAIEAKLKEKNT